MVKCYSNTTTQRLEARARARGCDYGVLKSPENSAGLYFLTRIASRVLTRWVALGWTKAEAEGAIDRLAAGSTLTPSQSGYTATVD